MHNLAVGIVQNPRCTDFFTLLLPEKRWASTALIDGHFAIADGPHWECYG